MLKTCKFCSAEFDTDGRRSDTEYCEQKCSRRARNRLYRERHLEQERQRWFKYHQEKKDVLNAKARTLENRAHRAAITRKRRKEQRETYLPYRRNHYATNPEPHRNRARNYRKTHKQQVLAQNIRWRIRKANNGGSYTVEQWEAMKAFYDYTCLRCRRREPEITLTVDHVLPVSKGGDSSIANLQPLCASCNSSKQTKHIDYRPPDQIFQS